MTVTIQVPEDYCYVLMTTVFLHLFTNMFLSSRVMAGRKAYKVEYPHLYATPGFHNEADGFNRIQRGHQNFLETLPLLLLLALMGGLQYPRTVAIASGLHAIGSILYQYGYSDTKLDVRTARFAKGGGLKHIGSLIVLVSAFSYLYHFMGGVRF